MRNGFVRCEVNKIFLFLVAEPFPYVIRVRYRRVFFCITENAQLVADFPIREVCFFKEKMALKKGGTTWNTSLTEFIISVRAFLLYWKILWQMRKGAEHEKITCLQKDSKYC